MILDKLICSHKQSIYDALVQVDQSGKGIVFVVDDHQHFIGTVTDGDIRRAILAKFPLDNAIGKIATRNGSDYSQILNEYRKDIAEKLSKPSVYAEYDTPLEGLLKLVNERISIIPLLKDKKVVDYFEHKAIFHAPIASPTLKGNELKYVIECMETNWISSQGRFIPIFENGFSKFNNSNFSIAVSNGTVAIHLALMALGIGPGDEVLVPDLTFGATINAVLLAGATPIIVDVDEDSWGMDPVCVKRVLNQKVKAMIPVHIYGKPCNIKALMEIAKENGIFVIEDCAEAMSAEVNGQKVGTFGDVGTFSFFANKIITTGEGGMCTTNSPELAEKIRILRDHGMSKDKRYWHETVGTNYRMTNIQAAIGVAQLEQVEDFIKRREEIENFYEKTLITTQSGSFFYNLEKKSNVKTVNWLTSFLIKEGFSRNKIIELASVKKIDLRPFFYPLSDMPVFAKYCPQYTPVTHDISSRGINLPTSFEFNDSEYMKISQIILEISKELV